MLLANVPHPLDPREAYTSTPLEVLAWRAEADPRRRPAVGRHAGGPPRLPQHRRLPCRAGGSHERADRPERPSRPAPPGRPSSARATTLTIVDLQGNQAVDFLVYDAGDTAVRYSAPDTIQAQGNIFLTTGSVLLSNEDPPLMTVVADDVGRHDTVGGACSKESNTLRYGHHTKPQHACVENFLPRAPARASASATSSATSTGT